MEVTQVSITDFSNYLVNFFLHKGDYLTNKKLQKLLYYVQAWHAVYFEGKNIFYNTLPQAWRHGPVFVEVYNQFKHFGFNPLQTGNNELSFEEIKQQYNSFNFTTNQQEYLTEVLNYYGKKNAFELEMLSHTEDPWKNARKGLNDDEVGNRTISLESMKEYYASL